MMRARLPALALLAVLCTVATGCTGNDIDQDDMTPEPERTVTSPTLVPDTTATSPVRPFGAGVSDSASIDCSSAINTQPPPYNLHVVADAVGLPDTSTFRPLPIDERTDGYYFAQQALVFNTTDRVDLIVPKRERHEFAIGYGNPYRRTWHFFGVPAHRTWHLRVDCRTADADWVQFAGGYTVARPRCVRLIVRVASRGEGRAGSTPVSTQESRAGSAPGTTSGRASRSDPGRTQHRVRIGIGTACPVQ